MDASTNLDSTAQMQADIVKKPIGFLVTLSGAFLAIAFPFIEWTVYPWKIIGIVAVVFSALLAITYLLQFLYWLIKKNRAYPQSHNPLPGK